jgi:hypothetical protein
MTTFPWQAVIWRQCDAAITSLEDAVRRCPDDLWHVRLWEVPAETREDSLFRFPEFSAYWYLAYHALFWLDLYLTGTEDGFVPPAPFLLIEQHEDGPVPERPYTQAELLAYLDGCRERCRMTLEAQTDETGLRLCDFPWGQISFAELMLYTMRHVQEHAAQLHLTLGQRGVSSAWRS